MLGQLIDASQHLSLVGLQHQAIHTTAPRVRPAATSSGLPTRHRQRYDTAQEPLSARVTIRGRDGANTVSEVDDFVTAITDQSGIVGAHAPVINESLPWSAAGQRANGEGTEREALAKHVVLLQPRLRSANTCRRLPVIVVDTTLPDTVGIDVHLRAPCGFEPRP